MIRYFGAALKFIPMNTLHCDKIEINEWYDGLIQGFVHQSGQLFYAILLAWHVDARKKRYLIVPMESKHRQPVLDAYSDPAKWPAARELIADAIQTQDCYFSDEMPWDDETIKLSPPVRLSASDIQIERFVVDQATTEPFIEKWLGPPK